MKHRQYEDLDDHDIATIEYVIDLKYAPVWDPFNALSTRLSLESLSGIPGATIEDYLHVEALWVETT